MPSFAERMGHREIRSLVQSDNLDRETRVALWNAINITREILAKATNQYSDSESQILKAVWMRAWSRPGDEQPSTTVVWRGIKEDILDGSWVDALNTIEYLIKFVKRYEDDETEGLAKAVTSALNDRFEEYLVGYRFINGEITPVDSSAEAEAVSEAIEDTAGVAGARHHLERAVELLADRTTPDYPNSIKESISAVEAVCRAITGKDTLGDALKQLESSGVTIHKALRTAWSAMYGYTSDADGIRHGSIDAPDADQALAKYVLVTCSAFVSYLTEAGRKAGLLS
ncbi:MAG: AbiJ-NTD4 domain-containing protein [Protaetiibacter sp.]